MVSSSATRGNLLTDRQPPQVIRMPTTTGTYVSHHHRSVSVTKAAPPTRAVSFTSDNDRRAQSNLRPPHSSQQHSHYRANSTGRIRDFLALGAADAAARPVIMGDGRHQGPYKLEELEDDPDAVTRAILDLRANRITQQQQAKRRSSSSRSKSRSRSEPGSSSVNNSHHHIQPSFSGTSNGSSQQENRTQRSSIQSPQRGRSSSEGPEDEAANEKRLKQAEQKIDGLLQELEDLRFFQELDQAESSSPPKVPPKPPTVVASAAKQTPPKSRSNSATPHVPVTQQQQPPLPAAPSLSHMTPPNNNPLRTPRGGFIPPVIRAISPTNRRLPPPPNFGDDDTLLSLEPRRISKMDRTSLELETQTLIRKIQVLVAEKRELIRAVQMYEASLQDQSMAANELQTRLQVELGQVNASLHSARDELHTTRQQLTREYQERIQSLQDTVEQLQQQLSTLANERDQALHQVSVGQKEHGDKVSKWKKEIRSERESFQAREAVLELQLQEATERDEELKETCRAQQEEMEKLREELVEAAKLLTATQQERDEAYQVHLVSAQDEITVAENKLQRANKEKEDLTKTVRAKEQQLEELQQLRGEDQSKHAAELSERLDAVHEEYRAKFSELKETYKSKENRRLNELVEAHSTEVKEYERRLLALQEQLTLATDRHYAEIKQKDVETEAKLETERARVQQHLQSSFDTWERSLEQELAKIRLELQESNAERDRLQVEINTTNPREALKQLGEMESKETLHRQEIARLLEKSDRLARELSTSDYRCQELSAKISETEAKHQTRIQEMESKHEEVLRLRDEQAAEERKSLRASGSNLRQVLAQKESELGDTKAAMDSKIADMKHELDRTKSLLSESKRKVQEGEGLQQRIRDLEAELEDAKNSFVAEKTRNENLESEMRVNMVVLEGKVRASESTLLQKREIIEELEGKLQAAVSQSSVSLNATKGEVEHLQKELAHTKALLQKERGIVDEQNEQLLELKGVLAQLQKKVERLVQLEASVEAVNKTLSSVENEKVELVVDLSKLQKDYDEVLNRLSAYENKADENSHLATELQLREKQANHINEQFTATIKELQDKLAEERRAKEGMIDRLGDIEADLELKEHQLTRLPKLQGQLKEMIRGREELQAELGRVEAELERKDKQIAKSSSKYSEAMDEFRAKIEEHRSSKEALLEKIRNLESELAVKTERVEKEFPELTAKINEHLEAKKEVQAKLEQAEAEIRKQKKMLSDASSEFSVDVQTKVEQLTKAKSLLETKVRVLEEESEEREREVNGTTEKYSNQILELQMKVEELTKAKQSLTLKLANVESELETKQVMMSASSSQYSGDVSALHAKLSQQLDEKERLQTKLDDLEQKLSQKERRLASLNDEKEMELRARLEEETREKRTMRLKIGDVEAELERKEKQIRDIVDRYSKDIADLENQLIEHSRAKSSLQKELDNIRSNVSDTSPDGQSLQDRIASLEKSIEIERVLANDSNKSKKRMEEKFAEQERAMQAFEERLTKATDERREVITALEEVINEVQSREEEIEALAQVLRKRDEELEHAKMIATKALVSAQEIKARYKDRSSSRNAEMSERVNELNKMVDFVSNKNEDLQRKTSRLERELHERESECVQLKNKLSGKESSDKVDKLDEFVSRRIQKNSFDKDSVFSDFDLSPTHSADLNEIMSTQSGEQARSAGWVQDFDTNSTASTSPDSEFSNPRTEPIDQSRRSIERDALRKYVRKRYLKSRTVS